MCAFLVISSFWFFFNFNNSRPVPGSSYYSARLLSPVITVGTDEIAAIHRIKTHIQAARDSSNQNNQKWPRSEA